MNPLPYAELRPLRFDADNLERSIQALTEKSLPILAAKKTMLGSVLMSNADDSTGYLLTFFEKPTATPQSVQSQDDAEAARDAQKHSEHLRVMVQDGDYHAASYARVITLPVPQSKLELAREVYESGYLPLLRQQAGFLGVMWLVDRAAGTGRGISFWSDRDLMTAADQAGEFFPKVLKRLATYFSEPPVMGYFTVNSTA